MIDRNKSLPVMDILHVSYANIVGKITSVFMLSYVIALCVYFAGLILPNPADLTDEADLLARFSYIGLFVALLVLISIAFYRLFALNLNSYKDLVPRNFIAVFLKMFLYLCVLLFVLFVAQLSVTLIFILIASIINNISEAQILNEVNMTPVVYFTMLSITLLIVLRLQPTFISIATNRDLLPIRSAFYYTRDNYKQLILIGLFSFVPAMLPILIVFYALAGVGEVADPGTLITFLVFPLFLLPYISVLSASVAVDKQLVPDQNSSEV